VASGWTPGVEQGSEVGPFYDSMLAKVIATGSDRAVALTTLADALREVRIAGPATNVAFLLSIAEHPEVRSGGVDTSFIDREMDRLIGRPPEPAMAAGAIEARLARDASGLGSRLVGPWTRTDSFELGGLQRRTSLDLLVGGESAKAEIVWTSGGPQVVSVAGHLIDGAQAREVVWGGDEAYVLHGGGQLRIAFPDPLDRTLEEASSGGEIVAPMHGRVVTVAVAPGDRVGKGAPLFALEAMKMEHSVLSPISGLVRTVLILPGQQIAQGDPAITIEPEHAGSAVE
jgi:3-methylcrotonyl-CoA carboxylase alpha subunit